MQTFPPDPDKGQRYSVCQRHNVLQSEEPNPRGGKRGRLQRLCSAAGCHHTQERAGHNEPRGNPLSTGNYCQGNAGRLNLHKLITNQKQMPQP